MAARKKKHPIVRFVNKRARMHVIFAGFLLFMFFFFLFANKPHSTPVLAARKTLFEIQSVDTMKFSRDLAREKGSDLSYDAEIEAQVKVISETGATHVAVGTPYDPEFVPYLARWVKFARQYKLNVWFRGNLSGWEGWFEYPKIGREEHTEGIEQFITQNPELFADGDILTPCPECENGGPGDPRNTKDVTGFREFLIAEREVAASAFVKIGKQVEAGYFSMNGDVARLIMDKPTTEKLGGVIVVDHYVRTPQQLANDVKAYAAQSGGSVILGEWGAPIPDIHGKMDEKQQAAWIEEALELLAPIEELKGVNYWTHIGGSTALWEAPERPREGVFILSRYFTPHFLQGKVINEIDTTVANANVSAQIDSTHTTETGDFSLFLSPIDKTVVIESEGYEKEEVPAQTGEIEVVVKKTNPSIFYRIARFIKNLTSKQ